MCRGDRAIRALGAKRRRHAAASRALRCGSPVAAELEIQFDDGSDVRLGNDAVVTLESLYSDSQGEFTELKLDTGSTSLHLRDKYSIFQIDTPYNSVKAAGPARYRVDVGSSVAIGVKTGSATLTASNGDTHLRSGDYVSVGRFATRYMSRRFRRKTDSTVSTLSAMSPSRAAPSNCRRI